MPLYDFKCKECDSLIVNKQLRISHIKSELPTCCDTIMGYHITTPPSVVWNDPVIEPFRSIATADRPIIHTAKERREYMARHDLVDSNELGPPPTLADTAKAQAETQASVDAINPTGQLKEEMKRQNLLDVVD